MNISLASLAVAHERPFVLLSFVGNGKDYWAPERTDSYATDCRNGRSYASELIDYIAYAEAAPFLGHVCAAIAASGVHGGVEVGFFQELAERLITAAR